MKILISIGIFAAGACFGAVVMAILAAGGRADEREGIN
jgi:hypothetical protein